jgi:hypothetical protein
LKSSNIRIRAKWIITVPNPDHGPCFQVRV